MYAREKSDISIKINNLAFKQQQHKIKQLDSLAKVNGSRFGAQHSTLNTFGNRQSTIITILLIHNNMQFIVPAPAINKIEKIGLDMPFDMVLN